MMEPAKKIKDEKKSQIIKAALKLFAEKGYHGTSTSMIAKEAGISKGLLYHYIESKEKLIQEICKTIYDLIYEHFDLNKDGVLTADEFEIFVRKSFEVIRFNKDLFRLIFSVSMNEDVRRIMLEAGGEVGIGNEHQVFRDYFYTHFKQPELELSFFIALTKGATLLYCTECDSYNDQMLAFAEEEIIKRFKIMA